MDLRSSYTSLCSIITPILLSTYILTYLFSNEKLSQSYRYFKTSDKRLDLFDLCKKKSPSGPLVVCGNKKENYVSRPQDLDPMILLIFRI